MQRSCEWNFITPSFFALFYFKCLHLKLLFIQRLPIPFTQTKSASWSNTKIEYRTNKPQRLPFVDVGLRDVGQANQAFKIELGHVCFS